MSGIPGSIGERQGSSQSRTSEPPAGTTSTTQAAPPPPPQPPKPSACERCRRRKTKCDGQRPKCSSCIKANVDCIEHDANRRVERSYLTYLEQRIAYLEADGRTSASTQNGHDQSLPSVGPQGEKAPSVDPPIPSTGQRQSFTSERGEISSASADSQTSPSRSFQSIAPQLLPSQTSAAADFSSILPPTIGVQQGAAALGTAAPGDRTIPPLATRVSSDDAPARKRKRNSPDISNSRRRHSSGSSDSHHSSSEAENDPLGSIPDQTHRHSALSCLVSVALEERQEPHLDEHAPYQLNDFLPTPLKSAERHFIHTELRALHNLRTKVRQQLHVPEVARNRTDIKVYDKTIIAHLMRRFFTWMGSVFPILHEVTASLQVAAIYDGTAATLDKFQVWMALAVALASLTRSHRRSSEVARLGKDFYEAARKLMPTILSRPGIERLQSVLLVLVYSLLVPRSASAAYLSTTAMQFAIELKLYSESSIKQKAGRDELMADVSRRIFWTSYNIDRSLSVITGKPTTLSDDWITTQFPLQCEDVAITREGIQPGAAACQLKVGAHQHTRLRQLQSCIQARLYTPSPEHKATPSTAGSAASPEDESAATDQWSWEMYDRLRAWRDSFTYPTPFITQEWIKLQFHLTTTYLFRPSPRRPTPDLDAVHVTLHSSVETLKLYKTMHRNAAINFSWMATHNLFMSGLAFLGSLRELRKKNANCPSMSLVDSVLQVQACASVLEVLALSEGDSGCRARDAFEQVSTLIIRQLEKSALDRNAKIVSLTRTNSKSAASHTGAASPSRDSIGQTPLSSPPRTTGDKSMADTISSSPEGHCRWASIALEDSSRTYFMAADREGSNGLRLENPTPTDRHFLSHDLDSAPLDPNHLVSLPKYLYSIGSFATSQPRGGKSFWASFVSQAPSRAGSPSAEGAPSSQTGPHGPAKHSSHMAAQMLHSGGYPGEGSFYSPMRGFDPSASTPSASSNGRAIEYGRDHQSPLGFPLHHPSQVQFQHQLNLNGQNGGGRRHPSGPSDGISPPSSAGTFDEFNLLSWFADPTSQAPSDGLGFTDLASENAMLQALGLSLPLPGLGPSSNSTKASPQFGPISNDARASFHADGAAVLD